MAFDFSTLVTDRTASDVAAMNGKGTYNVSDLNRVDACLENLVARLGQMGYNVPGYQRVKISRETKPTSRLPDGYTEVQYIQSSGTQHIDSGVSGDSDVRVVAEFDLLSNSESTSCIFGAQGSDNMRYVLCAKSSGTFRSDYGEEMTAGPTAIVGSHYVADKNRSTCKLNNDVITSSQATFSGNSNVYLFARSYSSLSQSKIKLYSCQIYKADVLTRDFVPCINASEVAGLYDLVGQKFYGNAGSGSFTPGETVAWPNELNEPTGDLDPYTWDESDIPTLSQMGQYRDNVAAIRARLQLPEETPEPPVSMRRLTAAGANSIESVLLAVDLILSHIYAAACHCGVTVCGSKGVIA